MQPTDYKLGHIVTHIFHQRIGGVFSNFDDEPLPTATVEATATTNMERL